MSVPNQPSPVKLIMSLISPEDTIVSQVCEELTEKYGEIDFISDLLPFNYTGYYCQEMGSLLWRRFISFDKLISRNYIIAIKLNTNEMEKNFLDFRGGRRVNIDPGFVSLENLILATGKNYIHRVYLNKGIFAELTLVYKRKSFRPLEWTYPDYKNRQAIEIFNRIREKCYYQLMTDSEN